MAASRTPNPSLDPATVHRTVLPNGLTVLVRHDPSAPVVAIVTYVRAGYFDEPDRVVGIAHVLEHMYFKGTPARGVGEIARATKAVGGYLNAGTIYDHTSYYTVLPSSGFVAGLDVQFDAYANSLIDGDELAREIEVIIEEAKRKADSQSAVTVETLYELLHDRHRMRRWRIGREPGLRALTRDDVVGFYRNHYRPSDTILVIVGDVDPAVALHEVEQRYGTLPAGRVERDVGPRESEAPTGFRYRELEGDVAQTQFAIGWRTPGTLHHDTPVLDLLAVVLGSGRASRLYRAVRERSLAQGISAYDYTPTELGVFVIHADARIETAAEAAKETWRQVAALRATPPAPVEIERAWRVYESRWLRRLESMEGQANYLAEWEALGGWQLGDEYLARLAAATPEAVHDVAARWLDPLHASMVTYRPRGTAPLADNAAAMHQLLARDLAPTPASPIEPPPAPPPARQLPDVELEGEEAGVRVYRTATGLPILVRRKSGAIAHAGVYVPGGATDEPAEHAGLTAMLTRLAVKGTTRRTAAQIAEAGELLGGSIGGGASSDSFGWSISVPVARLEPALELLGDVVQHAAIPADAFATEQAIAIADVAALRDDMSRYPMRLATSAAYPRHPYGTPVSGTEQSLAGLTADAVRGWHQARVMAGPAVAIVVGDVDADVVARVVARELAGLHPGSAPAVPRAGWEAAGARAVETRDKKQTALTMLFPGPARDDADRFATQLLGGIASGLGGRLFEQLRDRQSLCYTVHAFHADRTLGGMLGAYIATSPEKEAIAREGLLRELARFREEPVTAEELDRAQTYAIGTHAIRQESGAAVLGEVIDAWLFGRLAELTTYDSRIRAVTRERIQHVAARYLDPALRVEGVVRGSPR